MLYSITWPYSPYLESALFCGYACEWAEHATSILEGNSVNIPLCSLCWEIWQRYCLSHFQNTLVFTLACIHPLSCRKTPAVVSCTCCVLLDVHLPRSTHSNYPSSEFLLYYSLYYLFITGCPLN